MPQAAFLLSITGLGVSLAGFSGLVAALKRGPARKPLDVFRLRQIPEMALAAGFLALVSIAIADSTGSASLTIRIAGGAAIVFVMANALLLIARARSMQVTIDGTDRTLAAVINFGAIAAGVAALAVPTTGAYEWLLALLIARPGIAFLLALSDITAD